MQVKRGILYVLSGLALMATAFRFGYQIQIDGQALPGVYKPSEIRICTTRAEQAAQEICRGEAVPGYTLVPRLCVRYAQADLHDLTYTLTASYTDVATLYQVYAGKTYLGLTTSPDIIESIREDYLGQQADVFTTAVYLSQPITTRPVLSYRGAANTDMELSIALRQATEVICIQTPDDLAQYAKG